MAMVALTDQHYNYGTGEYEYNQALKVFEWNNKHIEQFKRDIFGAMKDELSETYRGINIYREEPGGNDVLKYDLPFQMYFLKDYSKLYIYYKIHDRILEETDPYFNMYKMFNNQFYQIARRDYGWELRVVTKDLYKEDPKRKNSYVEVYHDKLPMYTTGLWFNKVVDRYEFIQDKVVFYAMINKTTVNMSQLERNNLINEYLNRIIEINRNYHFTGAETAAKNAYRDYKQLMEELFDVSLPDTAINKCVYWVFEMDTLGTLEDRRISNERLL